MSMKTAHPRKKAPQSSSWRRSWLKDIPQAPDGPDDARPELLAQAVDVDVYDVRVRVEVHLPDVGAQVVATAGLPGVRHQVAQEPALALGEAHHAIAGRFARRERHRPAQEVERQTARAQLPLGGRRLGGP